MAFRRIPVLVVAVTVVLVLLAAGCPRQETSTTAPPTTSASETTATTSAPDVQPATDTELAQEEADIGSLLTEVEADLEELDSTENESQDKESSLDLSRLPTSPSVVGRATFAAFHRNRASTEDRSAARNERRLARIKTVADRMLDVRLRTLDRLKAQVSAMKRLPDESRSSLTTQIDSEGSALKSLGSKIQSATDVETARSKTKAILTEHRIFAVFIPKIRGLALSAKLEALVGKLENLNDRLNARIDEVSGDSAGRLDDLAADFEDQLDAAGSNIEKAESAFDKMEPAADLSDPNSLRKEGRQALRNARENLRKAARDLIDIVIELRKL